jgi:nitroimidazol reductase NimA-like FMN-containing flavoprotein (pyridoxamine 5'-phosphate oxidase superfamily)
MDSLPHRPVNTELATVTLLTTQHQGMDVLSSDECKELLRGEVAGRIGFVDAGQPIILPVNYAFVADSILFRTSAGSKLDVARRSAQVAFEIDEWDADSRSGWSVLAKGRADEITDDWFVALSERFGVEPWADSIPRDHWVRISIDELSGRWIFRNSADRA